MSVAAVPTLLVAGISGDHSATGISYDIRMRRAYDLFHFLNQKYGVDFSFANDLNTPILPNSIPPTQTTTYQLREFETFPVLNGRPIRKASSVLAEIVTAKSFAGSKCMFTFQDVIADVGHFVDIREYAPAMLHRIDRLSGEAPGTFNTNHNQNLGNKSANVHKLWTSGKALLLAVSSPTDFSPPYRLREITAHNKECSPSERIKIYDWIPPTDAKTSPGQLYLFVPFGWSRPTIDLWTIESDEHFKAPVSDGILLLANCHPLLVSFGNARNRDRMKTSRTWNGFLDTLTPTILNAVQDFEQMVDGWTTDNIIETPTQYRAGLLPDDVWHIQLPAMKATKRSKKKTGVTVRKNTRSNAAADAKAATELRKVVDRPRITRSQSTPNLNQKAATQAPVLKRKKSVKKIKKILKRAADDEDEGDDNAVASTSQAAAQDVRPMAKKKRT
ncbi:hypothetical protein CYLTODRAFT_489439 [Cylindrobasidium torrendii FP15055 ss-10]|uniref:Uncharacterized protein n=1 Tax=Cylindrobasidium torrendii FP15055 ss-10 TaxID=1314674 RepID=A0A0D7BFB3_9AGAR|nr:hypothetical protein CYLTODRAFT_489439 [Cylindrobasidium torrendii FP15055 ss-10]